ncbi:MAG: MATE family efflux transporter [Succinivibrionaceae bacterium]
MNAKTVDQKTLFQIAWPIFCDLSLRILTGSINILMIGRISTMYVAAMTVGNQIFSLSIVIFNFIGIGLTVAIAQMLGAGDHKSIRKVIHCAYGFNCICGLAVVILINVFGHNILNIMQIQEDIHDAAHTYLTVLAISLFPEALSICTASILRAHGYTKEAMYSSLVANLLTICSNTLLLFGFFGLPQLGIEGAAISIIVGRIGALAVLAYFFRHRISIRLHFKFLFAFKSYYLKRILRVGMPAAGENLAWNLQFMTATAFIASLGNYELATNTFYYQVICMYMMLFSVSLGMATEIIVAYHIGARNYEIAYHRLMKSLGSGFMGSFLIALIMACGLSELVLGIFSKHSSEVLEMAAPLILISVFMEPGRAFNVIVINSLRAANDTNFPMIMAIISMWGIAVPLEYFLGIKLGYGLLGIWIAFACDEWIRGISMFIRWRSKVWIEKSEKRRLKDKKVLSQL